MTNYRFTCYEGASILHAELGTIAEAMRHAQRSHKWFCNADRYDITSIMLLVKQARDAAYVLLDLDGADLFFDRIDVVHALDYATEWVWAVEARFYPEHSITYEEADKKLFDACRLFAGLAESAGWLARSYQLHP